MYIVDKEELKLINRCCTAPSLLEREMEGEAILVPAFVFHSIIVASQSFHRHTNAEQIKKMYIQQITSNIRINSLTIKNNKPLQGFGVL